MGILGMFTNLFLRKVYVFLLCHFYVIGLNYVLGQSKIEPAVQLIASILQIFLLSIVVSLKLENNFAGNKENHQTIRSGLAIVRCVFLCG